MNQTAAELRRIIDRHMIPLQAIPEDRFSYKPSPAKWSKKELIGHLVDSAQSNIRRFVVAQYEDNPTINYNQEKWVTISGYQQWDSISLIHLWYLLNFQICEVVSRMSPEVMQRTCMTQEQHPIEWLARDYIKHLLHHLHQILDLEPVPYP